jgi:hypothetical protein
MLAPNYYDTAADQEPARISLRQCASRRALMRNTRLRNVGGRN